MDNTNMLETENLRSMPVQDLIIRPGKNRLCFVIPYYQRGYRWSEIQVEKLLNDFSEFYEGKKNSENVGSYYCLQPIVVKRILPDSICTRLGQNFKSEANTDYYEVVDGQQRLTTLYILLKILNDDTTALFDLVYERDIKSGFARKQCLDTITSIDPNTFDPTAKGSTADEYYMKNACVTMKKWITQKKNSINFYIKSDLEQVLRSTVVIWYELPHGGSVNCYEVFRNINNGKIPLTDAELVKAMLLNRKFFSPSAADAAVRNRIISQSQDLYARQWDEIQRALSKPDVWSFITGGHDFKVHTRIDLLFKILVRKEAADVVNEDLGLFSHYETQLSQRKTIDNKVEYIRSVFEKLLGLYRTIQDWYENPVIYNYIGHIITFSGKKKSDWKLTDRLDLIIELEKDYHTLSHQFFINDLKCRIKKNLPNVITLSDLNYKNDRKIIVQLLMLFNIEELNVLNRRFNFILEANDEWSVEHIKAQHDEIVSDGDRKDHLMKEHERILKIIELERDDATKKKLAIVLKDLEDVMHASELTKEIFGAIASRIDLEVDGFDSDDSHRLGNLALLSQKSNSSFSNSPFYQKREKMLEWIAHPKKNIPHSTERVFLKLYSPQIYSLDFTRWGMQDFNAYLAHIEDTLKEFIGGR